MNSEQTNRRRFFRIVDSLGVSYRVITSEDEDFGAPSSNPDTGAFVDAYSLMQHYNRTIDQALNDVRERDPQAAVAIDTINRKVDAMLMMLELDSVIAHKASHCIEQASISASGLAFPVQQKLETDTRLALDLLLKPSAQHIEAIGRVVACDSLNEKNEYYLRVEFTKMTEKNKERLIQHIVQRQGELLRALRNEIDDF